MRFKYIICASAAAGLALTSIGASASDPGDSIRVADTIASYEYSANDLRRAVADDAVNHFELKFAWGSTDIMQAKLIAVTRDNQVFGVYGSTFVDRDLDLEAMEAMPPIPPEVREALPPIVAEHILDPDVAADFIGQWDALVKSGDSLEEAFDTETPILAIMLEKTAIATIVNRADASRLGVFWGLDDEDRVTPVFMAINTSNEVVLGDSSGLTTGKRQHPRRY